MIDSNRFFCVQSSSHWRQFIVDVLKVFFGVYKKAEVTFTNEPWTHIGYDKINYINLRAQSYFDSVSCGYHALANIINILTLLGAKFSLSKLTLSEFSKNALNDFIILFLKN